MKVNVTMSIYLILAVLVLRLSVLGLAWRSKQMRGFQQTRRLLEKVTWKGYIPENHPKPDWSFSKREVTW